MPCDQIYLKMREEERRRVEQERQKGIREIEDALARGTAKIVNQGGRFVIVGAALPKGMMDLCVLAKLQQRGSDAYKRAIAQAQAQGMNFAQAHAHAHAHGGHGGHGHGH